MSNLSDTKVSNWLNALAELKDVDIETVINLPEHQIVEVLTKVSIILSKRWDVDISPSDGEHLKYLGLQLLAAHGNNFSIGRMCCFCLKNCTWIETDSILKEGIFIVTKCITDNMNLLISSGDEDNSNREPAVLLLHNLCDVFIGITCGKQFHDTAVKSIASVVKSYASLLHFVIKKAMNSSLKYINLLSRLNKYAYIWQQLLSNLHFCTLSQSLPMAFQQIPLLNELASNKKSLCTEAAEGLCYYWRLLHSVFAVLAASEGSNRMDSVDILINIEHSSVVETIRLCPHDAQVVSDNRQLYMKLIAPADSVGILTPALTKLLKSSRYLASIAYSDIIHTLVRFPQWHQPHLTLKLLLRCVHHFLFLPPSSSSSTTRSFIEVNSNSSKQSHLLPATVLTHRIIGYAFFKLLSHLSRKQAKEIIRTIGVTVPSTPSKHSIANTSLTPCNLSTAVKSRAISPAVSSSSKSNTTTTPSTSIQTRVTMCNILEIMHNVVFHHDGDSQSAADAYVRCEHFILLIHSQFVHLCIEMEDDMKLFLNDKVEISKDNGAVSSCIPISYNTLSDFQYFPPLFNSDTDENKHSRHAEYRKKLKEGLFSLRNIFRRDDLLLDSDKQVSTTVSIEICLQQLQSTIHTFNSFLEHCSTLFPSTENQPASHSFMGETNISENLEEVYGSDIHSALQTLGATWTMQVYSLTFTLFQQLRQLSSSTASSRPASRMQQTNNDCDIKDSSVAVEFKSYHHRSKEDIDDFHQSLQFSASHVSQAPATSSYYSQAHHQASFLSQAWYQSTQLESLSGIALLQSSQQPFGALSSSSSTFQITPMLSASCKITKTPTTDNNTTAAAAGDISEPQQDEDHPTEQLVLAAAHSLAIQVTYEFIQLIMNFLESPWILGIVTAENEGKHLPNWIRKSIFSELFESVIESIWWFFHRTSGFGLHLEEVYSKNTAIPTTPTKAPRDTSSTTAAAAAAATISRISTVLHRLYGEIPWSTKVFSTTSSSSTGEAASNTTMDWVVGITWIHLLLFSKTIDSSNSKSPSNSFPMPLYSKRLSHAMKKSMNSITDAGLIPSLFEITGTLLQHLLMEPAEVRRDNSPATSWSLNLSFADPRQFDKAFNQQLILLHHNSAFVQYALVKMASMVAPSLSEQYTPELMTNMTSGLRDIFACIFLLQQSPLLSLHHQAAALQSGVIDSIFGSPLLLWAMENLFRLWLMLEDLLYRYQYTQLYQTRNATPLSITETAKQRHHAVEAQYDAEYIWPVVSSWALQCNLSMYINETNNQTQEAVDNINHQLLHRLHVLLRLCSASVQHEDQHQAASRIVVPLLRYFLCQFISMFFYFISTDDVQNPVIEAALHDIVKIIFSLPASMTSTLSSASYRSQYASCQNQQHHLHLNCITRFANTSIEINDWVILKRTLAVLWITRFIYVSNLKNINDKEDDSPHEPLTALQEILHHALSDWMTLTNSTKSADECRLNSLLQSILDLLGPSLSSTSASFLSSPADVQIHEKVDHPVTEVSTIVASINSFWQQGQTPPGVSHNHQQNHSLQGKTTASSKMTILSLQQTLHQLCMHLLVKQRTQEEMVHVNNNQFLVAHTKEMAEPSSSNPLPVLSEVTFAEAIPPASTSVSGYRGNNDIHRTILQLSTVLQTEQDAFYQQHDDDGPISAAAAAVASISTTPPHSKPTALPPQLSSPGTGTKSAATTHYSDDENMTTTDVVDYKAKHRPFRSNREEDDVGVTSATRLFTDDDVASNMHVDPLSTAPPAPSPTNDQQSKQLDGSHGLVITQDPSVTAVIVDRDVFPTHHSLLQTSMQNGEHSSHTTANPASSSTTTTTTSKRTYGTMIAADGNLPDCINNNEKGEEISEEATTSASKRTRLLPSSAATNIAAMTATPLELQENIQQTLLQLQVKWDQCSSASSTNAPVSMEYVHSLHEMLQVSHQLSHTLHILTMHTMPLSSHIRTADIAHQQDTDGNK